MKQLIIMTASIMLGIFLFNLILGPQEGSTLSSVKSLWTREIEIRTMQDGGIR